MHWWYTLLYCPKLYMYMWKSPEENQRVVLWLNVKENLCKKTTSNVKWLLR